MPGFDVTGPLGMGSGTGGGRGFCRPGTRVRYGYAATRPFVRGAGRGGIPWGGGRGRAFGGGRGWWRRPAYPNYDPYFQSAVVPDAQQEKDFLKNQADFLEQELEAVRQRLNEIEAEGAK